jgi:hypothetical protein
MVSQKTMKTLQTTPKRAMRQDGQKRTHTEKNPRRIRKVREDNGGNSLSQANHPRLEKF